MPLDGAVPSQDVLPLLVILVVLLVAPAPAGAGTRWAPPVPGAVLRPFAFAGEPFRVGRHRGVDLAARPGAVVRATCAGRVAVAGTVGTSGRVVTVRCGPWRVTQLPLGRIDVRPGDVVAQGVPIGTVGEAPVAGRRHVGLHLGVRREGHPAGYVDPLRFLARAPGPPPPVGPRAGFRPRRGPGSSPPDARPAPAPAAARPPAGAPAHGAPAPPPARAPTRGVPAPPAVGAPTRGVAALPRAPTRGVPAVAPPGGGLAPWPVWAGLALLLAGAAGAGVRWRPRNRRAAAPIGQPGEVR